MVAEQEAKQQHDTTIGIAVGVPVGIVALALLVLGICFCKLQNKRRAVQAGQINQIQTIASSQAPLRSHATSPTSASFSQHSHQQTGSWYGGQPPTTMPLWATGNRNISTPDTNTFNPNPPPQVLTWVKPPGSPPGSPQSNYPPPSYAPMGPGGAPVPQI
jgi:hypothetical protein